MHYLLKSAGGRPEQCDGRESSSKSQSRCEQAAIGCSLELIHYSIPFLVFVRFLIDQSSPAKVAIQAVTAMYTK